MSRERALKSEGTAARPRRRLGARLRRRLDERLYRLGPVAAFFTRGFHRSFYYSRRTWRQNSWLGYPLLKYPSDLWIQQEILAEQRPDLLVETGSYRGGSALFYASVMEMLGKGRVLSIDPFEYGERPTHPRIEWLRGSSTDPGVFRQVREQADVAERVMVVLDSDHRAAHVLEELRLYGTLVAPGGYIVVEDTCANGHPVLPDHGPGPMEAVRRFLAEHPDWTADRERERMLVTCSPTGYLKRNASTPADVPPVRTDTGFER